MRDGKQSLSGIRSGIRAADTHERLRHPAKHPAWQGVIAFDEFANAVVKRRPPPFEVAEIGEWTDNDDGRLALWLSQRYRVEPKDRVLMRAVMGVADINRFHPVANI